MKPELKLAQTLSEEEEFLPLPSMSIEELSELLKSAGAKEKKSASESETNQTASSLIKRDMEKDEKLPPQELLKKAEAWGREIARKEKVAAAPAVSAALAGLGNAAKTVGGKAHSAIKALGSRVSNIKDPIIKNTAIGSIIGGTGGAVSGLLDPKEDPVTGEKQRLRSAFRRGVAGTASGALSGALLGSFGKTSSVQKLAAVMEKQALGMAGIGSMAKNFVAGMKPAAEKAMGAIKPMAQNMMAKAAPTAVKHLGGRSMGQVAGMGAAGGAALGAAKGLVAPGRDPATGQPKSRLGAMAGGAVKGGLVGGALGAGAKAAVPHLQKAYKSITPGLHQAARTGANFVAQEKTAITPTFKSGITQAIPQRR